MIPNFQSTAALKLLWHSQAAESTWQSRLDAIIPAYNQAERVSVLEGIRPACQQAMSHGDAIEALAWASSNGLKTRVIRQVGAFSGFAHRYPQGADLVVLAMGRDWESIALGPDDETDLGYPNCCRKFWAAHFPETMDPVFEMAGESVDSVDREDVHEYPNGQGFPPNRFVTQSRTRTLVAELNPTLRYWSIKLAPHLPCSPTCKDSFTLGAQFRHLMGEAGDWAHALLSGAIHWSSYRGVVIVKTKLFRIIAPTDPLEYRQDLYLNGVV